MKNRMLPLLLALLMAASSFSMFACSESEVNNETETEASADTTADPSAESAEVLETTAEEARRAIPDDLPEETFGDKTFRVLTNGSFAGYDYIDEIIAEDLNGEACNDAIFNRNERIEERFKVVIECETVAEPHNEVNTIAQSGVTDYQIVGFQNYLINTAITAGSLFNWVDATYVDLDKPWHNKLANDDATINNILYGICSDLSTSSMTYTHAYFLNTELLADFGYTLDGLYTTIEEGKWTFDYFAKMAEGMYIDYNGSGEREADDIYGFGYNITNPADVWFTAFGGDSFEIDNETGEVHLTFMTDQTVSMYDALYNFHNYNPGYFEYEAQYAEETYFRDGKIVMAPMRFLAAFNQLREMEAVYTMIPYPKWSETQDTYYTNADDKFSVFGIPLSVSGDIDFISIIFEALAAESYKTVYPEYYDTALKGKYSSDPKTSEMVDLIMAGRAFDFSFEFSDAFARLPYFFRDQLNNDNANISSKYRQIEKTAVKSVERVIPKAYDLD